MPTDKKYTAAHVANYIILLAKRRKVYDLTPLKLIKLCYISYAWCLFTDKKQLFNEKPQAWKYGPVFPSLYAEFKDFGRNPITKYISCPPMDDKGEETEIKTPFLGDRNENEEEECGVDHALICMIFNYYKDKTGADLSDITHARGSAWDVAYKNGEGLYEELDPKLIEEGAKRGIKKFLAARKKSRDER